MENLELEGSKIFDNIKHIDETGNEFWYARDLAKVLEYSEYRKFEPVINKAMTACQETMKDVNYHTGHVGDMVSNHFVQSDKLVSIGSNAKRKITDYKLSRYACYLIVMNGDPRKEVIALGQTYFAVQTRKMELLEDDYNLLTEDEKRLYQRNLTKKGNRELNKTAVMAGVKNLDKFHNAGYKGLYNGETANDIAKRKKLRYREDILDNMGSSELVANLFRIDQTNQKLINDDIKGEKASCDTHYMVGKKVRDTIKELNGTMPEDMETPSNSLKDIKKDSINYL